MKIFKSVLDALLLVLIISFAASGAFAQKRALPPELSASSSLSELLDWLDKNSFGHARISLKYGGPEDYTDDYMTITSSRLSEEFVLSKGFRLASVEGCKFTLKNEEVKIVDWWTKSYNRYLASFGRFVDWGKHAPAELTPRAAVVFIPLDQMSYRKGKGPYRLTKDPEKARETGMWRTKYQQRGFFRRDIFGIEFYPAEPGRASERIQAEKLTFTFDDKEMSEKFNTVFRQAIRVCNAK